MSWIPVAGAAITFGLGMLGLLNPLAAARLTSIEPKGKLGLSEIRATHGGLFAALGLTALSMPSPSVHRILGLAWAGIAIGRAGSVVVDRSFAVRNLAALLIEGGIAALFLAPHWFV